MRHLNGSFRRFQRAVVFAVILVVGCFLIRTGTHPAWAAGPGDSQCVTCHTDASKLKALTPPDPPPTEEGEG
jgi:hypothetical protein